MDVISLFSMTATALTAASFRAYMFDYYREAPFNERMVDLYSRYFEILATAEEPVLIHCAAGKDRTGILAALTHHLAGVHRDDLMADYLATYDATIERLAPAGGKDDPAHDIGSDVVEGGLAAVGGAVGHGHDLEGGPGGA